MELIWPSPNGVDHLTVTLPGAIPGLAQGKCSTCGRVHNVGHALTVQRFDVVRDHGPCKVEVTDWPYECAAKDKNPQATVYKCSAHAVWWYEAA